MFKMLVRILNTLRSRIWDMVFFLFSDDSKFTVGKNGNSTGFYLNENRRLLDNFLFPLE
nr:hypothetical protein [uncultured Anaerobutyricum sp.]